MFPIKENAVPYRRNWVPQRRNRVPYPWARCSLPMGTVFPRACCSLLPKRALGSPALCTGLPREPGSLPSPGDWCSRFLWHPGSFCEADSRRRLSVARPGPPFVRSISMTPPVRGSDTRGRGTPPGLRGLHPRQGAAGPRHPVGRALRCGMDGPPVARPWNLAHAGQPVCLRSELLDHRLALGSVSGWPSGSDPEAKLPDVPAEANGLLNRYPERSAYPNAMPR